MNEYELTTQYDTRNSFYGKARVMCEDDKKILFSYDTPVACVDSQNAESEVTLFPDWNYGATTLRHVKEFLKQEGFTAESKTQIEKDYPITDAPQFVVSISVSEPEKKPKCR